MHTINPSSGCCSPGSALPGRNILRSATAGTKYLLTLVLLLLSVYAGAQCPEPVPNTTLGPTSVYPGSPSWFYWNDNCNATSYEIQVLRLFNVDPTTASTDIDINAVVDWKQALTVVTNQNQVGSSKDFWITLAEGTGYYVWRVRRMFDNCGGCGGSWSDTGPYVDGANVHVTPASVNAYVFFYSQYDDDINFIFSRKFEDADPYHIRRTRVAEKTTYANYLLMPIQEQVRATFYGDILAAQTVPDNLGRPSMKTLAAPLGQGGFGYKYNYLLNGSNNLYTTDDYDAQATAGNPSVISNASTLSSYYSDNNVDPTIPSAEQKPFSRTIMYNDGLNRPREVAAPGDVLGMNGNHTTKMYYGRPATTELVRLFGDEAPKAASVMKTAAVDPNKTISITYTDELGHTLATCLSAPQSPYLDEVDGNSFTVYDTVENRTAVSPTRIQGTATYTFFIPTTLNYLYQITPRVYTDACLHLCATCDYRVKLVCRNRDDEDGSYPEGPAFVDSFDVVPDIDSTTGSCVGHLYQRNGSYDINGTVLQAGTYDVSVSIELKTKDPVTKQLYIDKMVRTMKRIMDDNCSNLSCQVYSPAGTPGNTHATIQDIRGYLDNDEIWKLLIDYLQVDTNYATFTLVMGCDTFSLPTAHCERPNCDNPKFAEYMHDYLAQYDVDYNTSFFANALVNTTTNGLKLTTDFAANGFEITANSDINTIIGNMLLATDGSGNPVYFCEDLWKAWKQTVQNYASMQVAVGGGLSGSLTSTTPKVDWWFDFMQRVGYKVPMLVDNAPPSYPNAHSAPWKYFPYSWGGNPTVENGFCQMYSQQTPGAACAFPPGGPTIAPAWYSNTTYGLLNASHNFPANPATTPFHMYNFFMALKQTGSQFTNLSTSAGATNPGNANINQSYAQMEQACYQACEQRIDEAVTDITQSLMEQQIQVNGINYPAWAPAPTSSTDLLNVYCLAYSVVEQCKAGCHLQPVNGVVSQAQITAYQNSLVGTMDLRVQLNAPYVDCDPGYTAVSPSSTAMHRGLLAWLNRGYGQLMSTLNASGSTVPYTWTPLQNSTSFGLQGAVAPCSTAVNINSLQTNGNFSFGLPAANVTSAAGIGSLTRNTPDKLLPNDIVQIKLDINLTAALPAGYSYEIFEYPPTSGAGTVTVPSSTGWFDAGIGSTGAYRFKVTGPQNAGLQSTPFTYYIKVPNTSSTSFTVNFSGYVNILNASNAVIGTFAMNNVAIPIGCPNLYYNYVYDGAQMHDIICSNVCYNQDMSCTGKVCLGWLDPTNPGEVIPTVVTPLTCEQVVAQNFSVNLEQQLQQMYSRHEAKLRQSYADNCLDPKKLQDMFVHNYELNQYQYTLYYYDRAGNLIRTVAPEGVNNFVSSRAVNPQHTFQSQYDFNTLGQPLRQSNPDGGETKFWYDAIGKVRFSQTTKQANAGTYSYIKYDALERPIESGEVTGLSNPDMYVDVAAYPSTSYSGVTMAFVTRTFYTDPYAGYISATAPFSGLWQEYLQNRVSYTETDRDGDWAHINDQTRTIYSYDPHGHVNALYQWVYGMEDVSNNPIYKMIRYQYDPLSGKTNQVELLNADGTANPKEHYSQIYQYDGDGRLVLVSLTHKDAPTNTDWTAMQLNEWTAQYNYHMHGPLKRMVYGTGTQGLDYTYTIQGWLKGINHSHNYNDDNSGPYNDPGQDGMASGNYNVKPDVFGMVLNYFDGDFNRSGSPFNSNTSNPLYLQGDNLFNGNISSWQQRTWVTGNPAMKYEGEIGLTYRYDQLNRLKRTQFYTSNQSNTPIWSYNGSYDESFTYDRNGNIQTLNRMGTLSWFGTPPVTLDNFVYNYVPNTNQLDNVVDNSGNNDYDFVGSTFKYDATGNLENDAAGGITVFWTPANKADYWAKTNGDLEQYLYDAMGNRARKLTKTSTGFSVEVYIRDAAGNLLAVYESDGTYQTNLKERYIYGTDQVAVLKGENTVSGTTITALPERNYFVKDHLGNTRVVINEIADVLSYSNYYAFGAPMGERTLNSTDARFGFNGQEKNNDIAGVGNHNTALFWEYDTRYGRRWNLDPVIKPQESPYATFGNNPIAFSDILGNDSTNATGKDNKMIDVAAQYEKTKESIDNDQPEFSGSDALPKGVKIISPSIVEISPQLSVSTHYEETSVIKPPSDKGFAGFVNEVNEMGWQASGVYGMERTRNYTVSDDKTMLTVTTTETFTTANLHVGENLAAENKFLQMTKTTVAAFTLSSGPITDVTGTHTPKAGNYFAVFAGSNVTYGKLRVINSRQLSSTMLDRVGRVFFHNVETENARFKGWMKAEYEDIKKMFDKGIEVEK